MKTSIILALLFIASLAFAGDGVSMGNGVVVKLAEGYDTETIEEAFLETGRLGIEGLDTILTDWAVVAVEAVVWSPELEDKNPELFELMGMNRYLLIGWTLEDAQRPPYILNRMLSQLREMETVEKADRIFTVASE